MHPILDAVFRRVSPYEAELPYNLNWQRPADPGLVALAGGSISVTDVGCRGGLVPELRPIRQFVDMVGFDADDLECARLNAEPHALRSRVIFPAFIGGSEGPLEFYLLRDRGTSSAIKPDPRYQRVFGGADSTIEQTVIVHGTTLDAFFAAHPDVPRPDLLKLDTQGTELSVLQGAVETLKQVSMIEVEVEFVRMYESQPLAHDVMAFLDAQGFEPLHLNRVFGQRRGYRGWGKGQLLFGDILFGRREDRFGDTNPLALTRYLLLLITYGFLDIAHHVADVAPLSDAQRQVVHEALERRAGSWKGNRLRRALHPIVDKLALLLLWARKHNARPHDSDRSWPTR